MIPVLATLSCFFLLLRLGVALSNLAGRQWLPNSQTMQAANTVQQGSMFRQGSASQQGSSAQLENTAQQGSVSQQENISQLENTAQQGSSEQQADTAQQGDPARQRKSSHWEGKDHRVDPGGQALLSILVPARNEADNIGPLISGISGQAYANYELLVYDDLSTDETADRLRKHAARDGRIRLIPGRELPPGWLGKNHACHQLAGEASGDYLLFIDADVRLSGQAIQQALAHLQKHRLKLLSLFPTQDMHSLGEKLSVPLMNWILLSLLPLFLTRLSPLAAFSAANGQFMLFDAKTYRKHWFHQVVRMQAVEDIHIFREMKKRGLRVQTLLGNQWVRCRMYNGLKDALQGFSKNVFAFFGGRVALGLGFTLWTTLGFLPVLLAWGGSAAACFLAATLLLRGLTAAMSRQPLWPALLLAPMQQFCFILVIFVATRKKIRKTNTWKGRRIDP